MNINFLKKNKEFGKSGFVILKNVLDKKVVGELISEILKSKNTIKYFDNNKILRRTEKIYNKGNQLRILNNEIIYLLKKIFNKDFIIFKDKFNAKPPGGEGFFAHYDGIFHFIDSKNKKRNGWYEYGNYFINVLIALDKCTKKNGALELANIHKGSFKFLINNTKKNGTPAIRKEIESNLNFNLIKLNIGDIVIFSNKCPHRSKKNISEKSRRTLYYTYTLKKYGSKYNQYFQDKKKSKNRLKALEEK